MGQIADETKLRFSDTTDRQQEEIRQTEARVTETLHSIEDRFTASHIKDEIKKKVVHYSLIGLYQTSEALKRRQVQVALFGAAVAWVVVKKVRTRHRKEHEQLERVASATEDVRRKVRRDPLDSMGKYLGIARLLVTTGTAVSTLVHEWQAQKAERGHQHGTGRSTV